MCLGQSAIPARPCPKRTKNLFHNLLLQEAVVVSLEELFLKNSPHAQAMWLLILLQNTRLEGVGHRFVKVFYKDAQEQSKLVLRAKDPT